MGKKKDLIKKSLLATGLGIGLTVVAGDLTPNSWQAHAEEPSASTEKSSDHACGANGCGSKDKKKKGSDSGCGANGCGGDAKKKGSSSGCGANGCG